MPHHVWTVLCSKTVVDRESNTISLFEAIEALQLKGDFPRDKPVIVPRNLELVSLWERNRYEAPEKARTRFTFKSPDGTELGGGESEIDLSSSTRARILVQMNGIPIRDGGLYHFVVEAQAAAGANWQEVARLPLDLTITP